MSDAVRAALDHCHALLTRGHAGLWTSDYRLLANAVETAYHAQLAQDVAAARAVYASVVTDQPGRPVAAPCAISGCHYRELEAALTYARHKGTCATWNCQHCGFSERLHDAAEDIDDVTCSRRGLTFTAKVVCTCGLADVQAACGMHTQKTGRPHG